MMKFNTRILAVSLVLVGAVIIASSTVLFMGFLKRFFHLNNESSATVTRVDLPAYQQDWAAYLSTVNNDKVGSIMVDLGLNSVAPISTHPFLLQIEVPMRFPNENGLPLQKEFQTLNQIDETLSRVLSSNGAIYAGHLYLEKVMYLNYYISNQRGFESEVSTVMSAFSEYSYKIEIKEDSNWDTFKDFLYPQPIQLQSIHNRKIIAYFENQGDRLDKEREVIHWIYFENEQAREAFISRIKGKGFTVESKKQIEATDGRPYQLRISRVDNLTPSKADEYMLDLWQMAQDCGGEYDGWETTMIKN